MDNQNSMDNKKYDIDGLSTALMDEICNKYSELRGANEGTSFNLEEFLNDRFSETKPHASLKESISKLVKDGFLTQGEQNIDLTKKGIIHCRQKTHIDRGFDKQTKDIVVLY